MKRLIVVLISVFVSLFVACDEKDASHENELSVNEKAIIPEIGIKVADIQYRSAGIMSDNLLNNQYVFKSRADITDYINQLKEDFDAQKAEWEKYGFFVGIETEDYGENNYSSFIKYDDNFFEDNILVLLFVVEGSGSIRHKIERVSVKDNELNILMNRLYPGPGYGMTADMAYWNIFVPIGKDRFNGDIVTIEVEDVPVP